MAEDQKSIDIKEEKLLAGYPSPITYEKIQKILEQMKDCICQIKINKNKGTGTFCKIPYPDYNNLLPVLITNNHLINHKNLNEENARIIIYIKGENKYRYLELNNRIKYTNELYDITIIELKEKDKINHFIEIDDNIINDGYINGYIDEPIYIIQYPKAELSVSFGILENLNFKEQYNFRHLCSTEEGSSGSPILNLKNNKLIGIHTSSLNNSNFNLGLFFNYAITDFLNIKYYNTIKTKNCPNINKSIG